MSPMKYEHFIWHLIQICWKKNEAIEVERHRLSDLSKVTKLVSVRAQARSQPTSSVISHRLLCPLLPPRGGWGRREKRGKEGTGGEGGVGSELMGTGESKFVCQLSTSLVTLFSLSKRKFTATSPTQFELHSFPIPTEISSWQETFPRLHCAKTGCMAPGEVLLD